MIARLIGSIAEVNPETALIDVNGVGYEVHCSLSTLAEMQAGLMEKKKTNTKPKTKTIQNKPQPSKPISICFFSKLKSDT